MAHRAAGGMTARRLPLRPKENLFQLPDVFSATANRGHAAANLSAAETSNAVHLLRKKDLQRKSSHWQAIRAALAATHNDKDSLQLLAGRNSFFEDAPAYELLKKAISEIMAAAYRENTIRIWVPGCGTGEECYSIAMLFLERISAMERDIGLQIFATDVDAGAITTARRGYYPKSIQRNVPDALLSRYFKREGDQFRVLPKLRDAVVFSTHNLLVNVPFSRLDLISCRSLFNHLPIEAQNSLLLLFHFALSQDGLLFLGAPQDLVRDSIYFEPVSGRRRTSPPSRSRLPAKRTAVPAEDAPPSPGLMPATAAQDSKHAADVAMRYLFDTYAPASILIDAQHNGLHFFGPIHRYLGPSKGESTPDLIGSITPFVRSAVKKVLQRAARGKTASAVASSKVPKHGTVAVTVKAVPLTIDNKKVFLVSFLNAPEDRAGSALSQQLAEALGNLERAVGYRREAEVELDITRSEHSLLNDAYQDSIEAHAQVLEELQSTQIELQSLAAQYQAITSEYQQAAEDFENILSSSGIPTLFLDEDLRVRFLSQVAKDFFNLTDTDIGRPLADLENKFGSSGVLTTSRQVLSTFIAAEFEINFSTTWCCCRIAPYRKKDGQVKGVVIKFFDISALKRTEFALNEEKKKAEAASVAKSRFLAAASHDLRQPLQTLRIMQELLLPKVQDESRELVASSLSALTAMSGLLNTLLDINQLEAGVIRPEVVSFGVDNLLDRLKSEFAFHAQARGLNLSMVPCTLAIRSDPRLLEDMIRNLLSNAVKYTKSGSILFGCRRHADKLCIEVWDTGVGIHEAQQKAIFNEFHQVDDAPRNNNRGLGLGLAIVQRLGNLLGHKVSVRSRVGHGSVFAVEVPLSTPDTNSKTPEARAISPVKTLRKGNILIIEDEQDVRRSYELLLQSAGHHTIAAADGDEAIAQVAGGRNRPDLVIADYSLPGELNGVKLAARLHKEIGRNIPVVILTGDISIETLREISKQHLTRRTKPVQAEDLRDLVQSLLAKQVRSGRRALQ